jgi:hypothetical protein
LECPVAAKIPQQTDEELALALIRTVRETLSPEAVVLQRRITKCMAYMGEVTVPNAHTMERVRRYLDGTYDGMAV